MQAAVQRVLAERPAPRAADHAPRRAAGRQRAAPACRRARLLGLHPPLHWRRLPRSLPRPRLRPCGPRHHWQRGTRSRTLHACCTCICLAALVQHTGPERRARMAAMRALGEWRRAACEASAQPLWAVQLSDRVVCPSAWRLMRAWPRGMCARSTTRRGMRARSATRCGGRRWQWRSTQTPPTRSTCPAFCPARSCPRPSSRLRTAPAKTRSGASGTRAACVNARSSATAPPTPPWCGPCSHCAHARSLHACGPLHQLRSRSLPACMRPPASTALCRAAPLVLARSLHACSVLVAAACAPAGRDVLRCEASKKAAAVAAYPDDLSTCHVILDMLSLNPTRHARHALSANMSPVIALERG